MHSNFKKSVFDNNDSFLCIIYDYNNFVFRCCYKLVRAKFKWFGIQTRVENLIMSQEERLFRNFHRQLFCWMDEWYGLTMQDIRALEAETARELDKNRQTGTKQGYIVEE